ncbi:hypothetical protein DFH06DRAFT_1126200 [Mycena polygramma]|nr:hypothetical protein DFH06DRAFT_1126200 [Mycena polygramma]
MILDLFAVPVHLHERSGDLSVLATCSTICEGWSVHAQRLLFRRVVLPANLPYAASRRHNSERLNLVPSFLSAIDPATEHGRWLAESVVSLTMRHTGRTLTSEPTWLATAMSRTPNLRHLDVTAAFFNSRTLVQDFSRFILEDQIMQIVACFPSICILQIGGLSPALFPFDTPLNLSLVSCKYHVGSARDIGPGPYLASLLNPNPELDAALQVLSATGTDLVLEHVLKAYGTHLRSLTVKTPPQDSLAATCPHLERFALGRFPKTETLALVPHWITVLAIRGMPATPAEVDEFAQALELFPRLKTLAWSLCLATYPPLSTVASVCQRRGIELCLSAKEEIGEDPFELELRRKYIRI